MDKFKKLMDIKEMYVTVEPVAITPTIVKYINDWYKSIGIEDFFILQESLASTAIEGNDLSKEILGTLDRIKNKEPIGDRYLLQLAWFLRDMKEKDG